jgi:putative ABC transport system permease protein
VLAERLSAVPGVADVGGINLLPPSGVNLSFPFVVDNAPTAPGDGETRANFRVATPGYFEAIGVPLLAGRTFMAADRSDGTPVVVINQALATRYFPGQDPVGRQLTVMYGMAAPTPRLIIGVVGDVRQSGPAEPPRPELYLPYSQESFRWMTLVVRTEGDPKRLMPELRDHVAALDPQVAVDDVELLASHVAAAMDGPRFRTWLLSGFAALALLLALCGASGVMSYSVSTRMPEIALRMALGATGVSVARMILLEGLLLGAGGAALGVAGAALLERFVRPLLFGVAALDGTVILLLVLGSVAATIMAAAAPALRASRVPTLQALKTLDG